MIISSPCSAKSPDFEVFCFSFAVAYVLSILSNAFFDCTNALFDLGKGCFDFVTIKIKAVLAMPKLLLINLVFRITMIFFEIKLLFNNFNFIQTFHEVSQTTNNW